MARCLFVVSDVLWTGRARALVSAARGLAMRGHSVVVMAPLNSVAFSDMHGDSDATRITVQPLAARGRKAGAARVHGIRRVVREQESEIVFVNDDADHFSVALAMVGRRQRPALVRRIAVGERVRPTRLGRLAERLNVATQLLTGRSGIDRAGFEASRFRVELGVTVPDAVPDRPPSAPLLVCMYDAEGTIHASRVLRAVTMLRKRHRDLTLCMVASAEVPERLRMQAAALGLSRVVRWLQAPVGVAHALAHAAAVIVAVGGDDAVFATLDGMSNAVPVVAPRAAIFERYVANGISGILLDTFDAPACAAALATLVHDPERRSAMGGVARARVARDYPEQQYIEGLETLINALAPDVSSSTPVAGVA